jgi:hypothetical protein
MAEINLDKIERDVYRDYCQDGLADVLIGGFLLFVGPAFALLPLEGKLEPLGLSLAAVGAVLLASGVVTLLRFLRRNPVRAEETDDGRA